jgi:HEAT repeat protein
MTDEKPKREQRLDTFKTFSTFLSSVVIAVASFFATQNYNAGQLEIARNRALSELVPKLGDNDANLRKFTAISLALYGKNAVPALMAVLQDERKEVQLAAMTSLGIIGEPAAADVESTYNDKRNSPLLRANALYTLGLMKNPVAMNLAMAALENIQENTVVLQGAAAIFGMMPDKRAVYPLLSALKANQGDTLLILNILGAFSKIKDIAETKEVVKYAFYPNENIRVWALWALKEIGDTTVVDDLRRVELTDSSERVRGYAGMVIRSLQPSSEVTQ